MPSAIDQSRNSARPASNISDQMLQRMPQERQLQQDAPKSRLEDDYQARIQRALPDDPAFAPTEAGLGTPPGGLAHNGPNPAGMNASRSPQQFGYDVLSRLSSSASSAPLSTGAIGDQYMLGVGDEIVITLRGQKNQTYRARVDQEGRVIVPELKPVAAAGRPFGEFRNEMEALTAASFLQTEIFVSVGAVRSISVYVLGEVAQPGAQRLTGLSSLVDALVTAGGVRRTGSLRSIEIVRGQTTIPVDLYGLLMNGHLPRNLSLMEGDRILVRSLGQTVAVAGEVERPAIYELPANKSAVTVKELLALSGGALRPTGYRMLKLAIDRSGADTVTEVDGDMSSLIRAGEVLVLAKVREVQAGAVSIEGHVSAPGVRSLSTADSLAKLVSDKHLFKENPYLMMGILETSDETTLARYYVPVNIAAVMDGKSNGALKQRDKLIVLSAEDIRYLASDDVQAVLTGRIPDSIALKRRKAEQKRRTLAASPLQAAPSAQSAMAEDVEACAGLKSLAALVADGRRERFSNAILASTKMLDGSPGLTSDKRTQDPERYTATRTLASEAPTCPAIYERYPDLLPFLLEWSATVQGEVRSPGIYPVAPGSNLASMVAVTGGLTREADIQNIEVSRFERQGQAGGAQGQQRNSIDGRQQPLMQVTVMPGDSIRFNAVYTQRESGSVRLGGEVRRPGYYAIQRGERLSQLLERAGGLTEQSYPLGTVFARERIRKQEVESNEITARDLESTLAAAVAQSKFQTGEEATAAITSVRELISSLRNTEPVGRVVAEADPALLQVRPELDTVLEPGDYLFIPKRPNHVSVSGEVLNPGAQQFRSGLTADEYIRMAGGMKRTADDGRVFVIYPNGIAEPISISSWNFTPVHIPPGSTIMIPRDPRPFDWLNFSKDIADVLSKVAITGASLAVINR